MPTWLHAVELSKQGEIEYLERLGAEGTVHAFEKPFSDIDCGRYLVDLGFIMTALPAPPCRLLDRGIGTGWTSAFLACRGYEVTGVDIAPRMITAVGGDIVGYLPANTRQTPSTCSTIAQF